MSVSRSPAPSSIDLSGVPARVAEAVAQVVAVCHEQFRSDPCPEAFEEAELRVRETMNALACELLGAVIEKRDDGASRIERDGQSWFRVAATPRTIMTSLGPLTYRRARYRSGASGSSPVPVDESLGLVDDYLTRPAAQLGLLMMGHCTAREAAAFFAKIGGMTPSVSTLQRLTRTMHERWETLGPETLDSIRDAEGVPHEAGQRLGVARRRHGAAAGRRGRPCRGLLARGRLRHGFLPRRQGRASEDPLSRPHAGERQGHTEGAARKRSRTYQAAAPRRQDRRYRRRRRRQLDLPGDPVARNRGHRLLACLRTSPNGIRPCGGLRLVREVPRGSASRPLWRRQGDPGVAPPTGSRGTARFCVTTPVASTR